LTVVRPPQVIMPTANSPASKEVVTAALLVIGGKILSGRTKDQNIGYIAEYLTTKARLCKTRGRGHAGASGGEHNRIA